jgi:hypothetical protein
MTRFVLFAILLLIVTDAMAAKPYRMKKVVPIYPESAIQERVSAEELRSYVKRLSAELEAIAAADKTPRAGFIMFAVNPDGRRKIWPDLRPLPKADAARAMISRLESAAPCHVAGGTFAAALDVSFWGAKPPASARFVVHGWQDMVRRSQYGYAAEFFANLLAESAGPGISRARCIDQEKQLSELISSRGKPVIVLEAAIERIACDRESERPVDLSRIASTNSHLIIHGPNDDIHALLALAKQNAEVLEELLPESVSPTGEITPRFSGASEPSIVSMIGTHCRLSGSIDPVDSDSEHLWVLPAGSVEDRQFCLHAADYFAVFGIALTNDDGKVLGRRIPWKNK